MISRDSKELTISDVLIVGTSYDKAKDKIIQKGSYAELKDVVDITYIE